MTFDPTPIKLNQHVFMDTAYRHPQLGTEVGREFFDRVAQSAAALASLTAGVSRSVVLVGERRMGKTSLFRHLIERLKATPGFAPAQLPTGGSLRSVDDLFGEIVDQAAAVLGAEDDALAAFEPGLPVDAQLDALGRLCAAAPGLTLVLCLDELDVCLEHQEAPAAERAKIAALVDGLARRGDLPVRLLCTMIRQPERMAPGTLGGLLDRSTLIYLPPFSRADLDEMVNELALAHLGVSLTSAELETFYRESGGWPFFAKLILVALGECALDECALDEWAPAECALAKCAPDGRRVERAVELAALHPAVGEAVAHVFRHYFDRHEKALVIELARQQGRLSAERVARLRPELTAAADSLVKRNFVEPDPDGGYRFRVGLLGPWFRQWSKFQELAETYRLAG